MATPGTSGKIPDNKKTVTGHFNLVPHILENNTTRIVASKVLAYADTSVAFKNNQHTPHPTPPIIPQCT